MRTQNLTPNTTYAAYLIMKVCDGAFGVEFVPSKVSVTIGKKVQRGRAYLGCKDEKKCKMESLFYGNRREVMGKAAFGEEDEVISIPWKREDGWMEIELGEFFIDEADEEITMNLREVSYQLKGGIIIEGIEIRPKHAPWFLSCFVVFEWFNRYSLLQFTVWPLLCGDTVRSSTTSMNQIIITKTKIKQLFRWEISLPN